MKHVGRLTNAVKMPSDNVLAHLPRSPGAIVQAEYAWLAALPIAGALFRVESNLVERVFANAKFDEIALGVGRASGLDIANIADRILKMAAEKRDTHFECWRSNDIIHPRELEISIARFGVGSEEFLLSMFDRTAEAIGRSNLRREMLSDSLTGFCNRTGFEEQVENAVSSMLTSGAVTAYAIILVDLARFSRVNESVGAVAGD